MTSLASLDVTNNKLTEVPPALQDLGHLGNETMNINVCTHLHNRELCYRGFVPEEQQANKDPCSYSLSQFEGTSSWIQ